MPQPASARIFPLHHKLFGLDHLRAVAITLVFLFHYGGMFPHPQWLQVFTKIGWAGVDLFFVLSGYLIAAQLFAGIAKGKGVTLWEFFIKRSFRILPIYLLVLAVYFLLPTFREREALAPLWKYLTFTQNIGLNIRHQGTFSHAWSLCIEEQFYLCLPLVLLALANSKLLKYGYWLLIALFVAGFCARIYAWSNLVAPFEDTDNFVLQWYKWIYYPTYSRLDGLLIGVSIAAIFQFKPVWKQKLIRYGNLFTVASFAVFALAYVVMGNDISFNGSVFGFPLVDFGFGLLVLGAICPNSILYKLTPKPTAALATLSYGIYVSHKITIHLTQTFFAKRGVAPDSDAMFWRCVVCVLLVAWVLNKLIEKPFLRLRNKVLAASHAKAKTISIEAV